MSDSIEPAVDTSQQRAAVDAVTELAKRVHAIELAFQFARGATFVVLAILTTGVSAVAGGALNTRDIANANAARLVVVEKAQSDTASQLREGAAEARSTHDAIVRMTSTMEALLARVDALTAELRARESNSRAR